MIYHLIYNPIAGKGKSKQLINQIIKYVTENNIEFILHETQFIGHAQKITHELTKANEPKALVVIGGDGTLHEVVNGIVDFNSTYLGILPCGSGNDFAESVFKGEKDFLVKLERVFKCKQPHKIDFIEINNNQKAINVVGFGIDSDVLDYYERMKFFSPWLRYKIATFQKALFFHYHDCWMQVDNNPSMKFKTILLGVGNGSQFGGGIKICHDAQIDDGYLTISYLGEFKRIFTIHYILKILRGNSKDMYKTTKAKQVKLHIDNGVFEADGEICRDCYEVTLKISDEKINLLA